ncbi:MAG: IS5 family transposase [Saprospiraceae bacterium]
MGQTNKTRKNNREKYRITNWSSYNESLKNRGKITFWFSDDVKKNWYYNGKNKPGGKIEYSDSTIECILIFKYLYSLCYRQTEGFVRDLLQLMSINDLVVPSYCQIQRRSGKIEIDIRIRKWKKQNINVVIDSTGLKVYGEGEWKVRKHGWSKHRTWRKLHMGSDEKDLEILSVVLTGNEIDDATAGTQIVDEIEQEIESVAADGAYDKTKFRCKIPSQIIQLIPPRKNAIISTEDKLDQRNDAINRIAEIGREKWKEEVGYHIRSKSEVNMFRYKIIFTEKMKSRKTRFEETEVKIKSKILNKFVELGMPMSVKVS